MVSARGRLPERGCLHPMEWSVSSCKVLVFGLRLGYPSKAFLFYLEMLPVYEKN